MLRLRVFPAHTFLIADNVQHFLYELFVNGFAGPLQVAFHVVRIGAAEEGGGDALIADGVLYRKLFDRVSFGFAVGCGTSAGFYKGARRRMPGGYAALGK